VHDRHLIAARHQSVDYPRTDELGAAKDQDPHAARTAQTPPIRPANLL